MSSSVAALRRASVIMAVALVLLLLLHVFAIRVTLPRALHFDEAQYLHVAWLMDQGKRLYVDFVEDHSPFLFLLLRSLLPDATQQGLDLILYAGRARILAAACGVLALVSVALLTWRLSGGLLAPLIATATLLGSPRLWYRGLADARNDPPTLFLFWLGVFLLIVPWKSERTACALAGTGIGLAATAALWNPKMPFECLVLAAVYLWKLGKTFRRDARMVAWTIIPAASIVAVAIVIIARTASLGDYVFFTFEYNVIIGEFGLGFFGRMRPFLYCDRAFRGVWPIVAIGGTIVILAVPALRARLGTFSFRAYAVVLALAIAAILDIRFLFPYPNLWAQYYVMWGFALAVLYGLTAAAALRSVMNARFEAAVQVIVTLVAVFLVHQTLPTASGAPWSWLARDYLGQRLRPGETVWLTPPAHPIAAHDASYYWFAYADLVPASLDYTAGHPAQSRLPHVRQDDLPICRAERGLEPNLRFVSGKGSLTSLPIVQKCLDRMIASGAARPTRVRDVWELTGP